MKNNKSLSIKEILKNWIIDKENNEKHVEVHIRKRHKYCGSISGIKPFLNDVKNVQNINMSIKEILKTWIIDTEKREKKGQKYLFIKCKCEY